MVSRYVSWILGGEGFVTVAVVLGIRVMAIF
jgi:hypothetical protein